LVESLKDIEVGSAHRERERSGVGAVAVGAVLRNAARLGGKGDQRTLRGLHLRQPASSVAQPNVLGVLGSTDRQAPPAERVVATGIQDDDVEPRAGSFHLAQHQIGVEHLEVDVRLFGWVGINRNEVVFAADLHAMARIVEQPHVGSRQLRPEGLHRSVKGRLVEIELRSSAHERETESTQGIGQELGIVGWIIQYCHIAVGRIADHKCDAFFRKRGRRQHAREQKKQPQKERPATHKTTFEETTFQASDPVIMRSRTTLVNIEGRDTLPIFHGAVTVFPWIGSGIDRMKRRDFITLLGGAAAAWPFTVRAQPAGRMRRVGVLMALAADDPEGQTRFAAFLQGLQERGWSVGRNMRIDTRWGGGNDALYRKYAAELAALAPDVLLAGGGIALRPLRQATSTLPIVFASTVDPVGEGAVESLARPGGNVTGFTLFEYGISGKWLELLKQISPQTTRVAVIRDATISSGAGQLGALQGAAPSLGVELTSVGTRSAEEIERGLTAFVRAPNGGLIVTSSAVAATHRELIVALAARHRLQAMYANRVFVDGGGLMSYGPDRTDQFRVAAGYVDCILKGEKPADLPVQAPTKFELIINMKVAKALGLTVPQSILLRADEVIE
jgi:putative ABC transport system substrate-binding protein